MKKLVLLFAFGLFSMSMAAKDSFRPHWKYLDEPVKITVRGIDFFVFPNGEFDFNAHQRRNRHYHGHSGFGIRIDRDRYGKIRRIGNVFINYNRYRQVSRIGNVFIKYNHRGRIYRIGKLRLKYMGRRYAVIRYHKPVHPVFSGSIYFGTKPSYVYDEPYYDEDYDEYDNNEDSDYYYRPKKEDKKIKIKGRRK